ncbi:MAG: flap endonuclease-1 [Methanomicrobiaceae archaeon]|nr:flap endonuclease-1 [Methanomicrobiaceae archaeon]
MGVAIRDLLADYKTTVEWNSLGGIGAIDAHNALYQFLSIIRQPDGTPLMDREGRVTSHLSGIFFRTINFLEKGIRPVFIFDGPPPEFKAETVRERRETRRVAGELWIKALKEGDTEEAYRQARSSSRVDAQIIGSAKELLRLMKIPFVDAPSEGEAQAASMARNGVVSYAVSQDYDALLFGAPVLVRNLTVSSRRKVRGRTIVVRPERIILRDVLEGHSLSREDLIKIGILIGTDFNPGIRGVGAKTALKIVRQDRFLETIREKSPDFDFEPVLQFFLEPPNTSSYSLQWGDPNPDEILAFLCETYDFAEERIQTALDKIVQRGGQRTLDQWF